MTKAAAEVYQTQQILTASPARLVATLYQAAITSLRRAIQAIEDGDVEGRWRANKRAIEIIDHLAMTLDTEQGGEIAANLERLYSFIIRRLAHVDLHNDPTPAREAIGLIEPLLRSWCELDKRLIAGELAAPAGHAAPPAEPAATENTGDQPADAPPPGPLTATA